MKQGAVHLQAARHEAVRCADGAVKIQQERLAAEVSLTRQHSDALLVSTASKVMCLDVSLKCQVALHL